MLGGSVAEPMSWVGGSFSKCKFEKCVSYTENRVLYTVFRVAYTAHFRGFGGDYKI